MKVELPFFEIEESLGGQQIWFPSYMMRLGGCATVTACDCCIYFELYKNLRGLYPFDAKNISKADYINFAAEMKKYLHPRWHGIDTLNLYIEQFEKFLRDAGETNLKLSAWDGDKDFKSTHLILKYQLDNGFPIPFLMLEHTNPTLEKYTWHWFLLTGYEILNNDWRVKVTSYGVDKWFNFDFLWYTGFRRKGGLIVFSGI